MRVIQIYSFKMGTKMPYSDCPAIIHRFLQEKNLTSHRFLYFFKELVGYMKTPEEQLASGSCAKAVNDCPNLGEIRYLNGRDYGLSRYLFVSNIDTDTSCTESDILPHMKKIHRRYGFSSSKLYYYDIDFFHQVIPWERNISHAEDYAKCFEQPLNPALMLSIQPYGSGIELERDISGNCITLSIDILHNGEIYDATPYCDAMKALLPNIKPSSRMAIYLNDEEKQRISNWNTLSAPVVEKSQSFFAERIPTKERQNLFDSNYTLSPKLKKLAKQYGFFYHYEGFGCCVLDKKTPRGHVLRIWAESPPSRCCTRYHVNIQGVGFSHDLCRTMQTPTNQAESDACSETMFAVVSDFEINFLPELDAFYEETPNWFVPSAW